MARRSQKFTERLSSKVALAVVAALATLLAAEGALRLAGYEPYLCCPFYFEHPFFELDEHAIFRLGNFDEDATYAVPEGCDVIVTLGDSFTQSYPVAEPVTYPAVMHRQLAAGGWKTKVINLGIGNTGSDQHLRIFEAHLLTRLNPDIVVWGFYANDVRDNQHFALYTIEDGSLVARDASSHWLYRRQELFEATPLPVSIKMHSPLLRLLYTSVELGGRREEPMFGQPGVDAWSLEKIALQIQAMERLADRHGFVPYYLLIPPESIYMAQPKPEWDWLEAHHNSLRRVLERSPRFIEAVIGEAAPRPPKPGASPPQQAAAKTYYLGSGRDSIPEGGRHLNEAGYELMAKQVAARLLADRAARETDANP